MKQLSLLSLLVLTIFLGGCESKEAKMTRQLVGTWHMTDTVGEASVDGTTTLLADGRMKAMGTIKYQGQAMEFKINGKWKVEKDSLQWTAEDSSLPQLVPVGFTSTDKIVSVTAKEFTYTDSRTGRTILETRVK